MEDEPSGDLKLRLESAGGLWAAVLEDAPDVSITLNTGQQLGKCTVIRADDRSLLLRNVTGVLLVPVSSILYVQLSVDETYLAALRAARKPRPLTFG